MRVIEVGRGGVVLDFVADEDVLGLGGHGINILELGSEAEGERRA